MNNFEYKQPFALENGAVLPELSIEYHTYGLLNNSKSNVVWICHALTANADAADWWSGFVGQGKVFDPADYFIVCANILGSVYGTTGPLNLNPQTGKPYFSSFPQVTIRDMVNAHILLKQHLGINEIFMIVGGSMGGYQAMEWAIMEQQNISNLILLATSAAESAWGQAVHAAQRLAIEADITWNEPFADAGNRGLKAARAIGLISYRNYDILVAKQTDEDVNKMDHFKAASYINYQGKKLVNRFNAFSYWLLTKAMDSHHVARNRAENVDLVLKQVSARTLVVGISSDLLCPVSEQEHLAQSIPNATLVQIDSPYGHDGFIVEWEKISVHIKQWLSN